MNAASCTGRPAAACCSGPTGRASARWRCRSSAARHRMAARGGRRCGGLAGPRARRLAAARRRRSAIAAPPDGARSAARSTGTRPWRVGAVVGGARPGRRGGGAGGWLVRRAVPARRRAARRRPPWPAGELARARCGASWRCRWATLTGGGVGIAADSARRRRAPTGPRLVRAAGPRRRSASLVGGLLVLVFGALFRAADPAFADLRPAVGSADGLAWPACVRAALGFALRRRASPPAWPTSGAAVTSTQDRSLGDPARVGVPEWVIPIGDAGRAVRRLRLGPAHRPVRRREYVLGPGGPDYAEYARGGFVQLMWVTVLTLGVVAALTVWARRETRAERVLLRVLGRRAVRAHPGHRHVGAEADGPLRPGVRLHRAAPARRTRSRRGWGSCSPS